MVIAKKLRYDNCYACANLNCEHAGKNREFIIVGEKSCKVPFETRASEIRAVPDDGGMANLLQEFLLDMGWPDHEKIPSRKKTLNWLRERRN